MKIHRITRSVLNTALLSLAAFITEVSVQAQQVPDYPGLSSPTGQAIEPGLFLGFGNDDRLPMTSSAYPWSAIGRVQINGGGHCTGALIARDLVLTNAHCIFENGTRRFLGASFSPNYKNGSASETVRGIDYYWGTDDPSTYRVGVNFTGPCSWPDGLYRSSEKPEVYYLRNGSASWVRTPQKVEELGGWGRVRLIDNTSRQGLTVGRSYSERC